MIYECGPQPFLAPGTSFKEDSVSTGRWGGGLWVIRARYIYCALYFYTYYISSTPDHQGADGGDWGPRHTLSLSCPKQTKTTFINHKDKVRSHTSLE